MQDAVYYEDTTTQLVRYIATQDWTGAAEAAHITEVNTEGGSICPITVPIQLQIEPMYPYNVVMHTYML